MSTENINAKCKCPYNFCPRHGKCDKCKAYHAEHGGETFCSKLNPVTSLKS